MISKKINELKKQKKLTNQKLSEISGVPLGTLNKITSGVTTDPKLETLKSLAKALKCSLDDFETLDVANLKELPQDKKELLDNYDKLNEEGKEEASKRVEELTQIPKYTSKEVNNIIPLEEETTITEEELSITTEDNIADLKNIKIYDTPVSAGKGSFMNDYEPFDIIKVNLKTCPQARRCDFALKVRGDSMEPYYYDGDIVFVKEQPSLDNGQIGIFIYEDEAYIKKYSLQEDGVYLVSLNKKYPPIKIDENNTFKICGLVLTV